MRMKRFRISILILKLSKLRRNQSLWFMEKQNSIERYKVGAIAAFVTLLIGLVIITPLCGLLFQCRCDWPWLNFYFECNYFHSEMHHKCPWCNSDLAGLGSIGVALILAMLTALFLTANSCSTKSATITVKVTYGLTVFILVAVMTGALAAYSQHYPLGIGGILIGRS